MIIIKNGEEIQELAEELGIEHEDFERLAEYVTLVGNYTGDDEDAILRDNLEKWAEWEQESYYGTHATPAEFAKFYAENYADWDTIPNWVAVDWQQTWEGNLRHDFYFAEQGYVWAEIY